MPIYGQPHMATTIRNTEAFYEPEPDAGGRHS